MVQPPHPPSKLDEILQELEEQFSSGKKSKQDQKKSQASPLNSFLAAITLVLLLVGGGVGFFLSQKNQELRQRAQVVVYYSCGNPNGPCFGLNEHDACTVSNNQGKCVYNTSNQLCGCIVDASPTPPPGGKTCLEIAQTTACFELCIQEIQKFQNSNQVACQDIQEANNYCVQLRGCTDPDCPGQPQGSYCTADGARCDGGTSATGRGCEYVNGVSCCPPSSGGGGTNPSATPITTATQPPGNGGGNPTEPPVEPTQIVVLPTTTVLPTSTFTPRPTNTSVPTTPGQPTNTPVPLPTQTFTIAPTATQSTIALNTQPSPTATFSPTVTQSQSNSSPSPTATRTPNPTQTSSPIPTSSSQNQQLSQPGLPSAGNDSKTVQLILTTITVSVIVGAIALLLFL